MNAHELKEALRARTEEVCQHLLPGGKRSGNYWQAGSVNGEAGGSLRVCLSGEKAGVWSDFAGGDKGGDILSLWREARKLSGYRECSGEIHDWLGVRPVRPESVKKRYRVPPAGASSPLAVIGATEGQKKVLLYLTAERKIPPSVVRDFDVGEKNGDIAFRYFDESGEMAMIKFIGLSRPDGKKRVFTTSEPRPILYGMNTRLVAESDGVLLISEGEIDAMTWQSVGFPAVSVPFGAKKQSSDGKSPNDEWISNCYDWLERFHTIYVAMDMDQEGQAAASTIIGRLGKQRCRMVSLPLKDANKVLTEGATPERTLKMAVEESKVIGMEAFASGLSIKERVWSVASSGRFEASGVPLLGWDEFHFRVRPREGTIITGYANHGKSNFMYQVAAWLACCRGERVFIGSYEEPAEKVLAVMARQAVGRVMSEGDRGIMDGPIAERLLANLFVHDREGTIKQDEFFEFASYATRQHGVKHAFFDSASCADIDLEDNKSVESFTKKAQTFWKTTGAHLWLCAHPRKGINESIPPRKQDIKGSGFLPDLFFNVLTVHRDSSGTRVIVAKQKVGGTRPDDPGIKVIYDPKSSRLVLPGGGEILPYFMQ